MNRKEEKWVRRKKAAVVSREGFIMDEVNFEEVERLEEYEALMQQVEDGAYDGDGP